MILKLNTYSTRYPMNQLPNKATMMTKILSTHPYKPIKHVRNIAICIWALGVEIEWWPYIWLTQLSEQQTKKNPNNPTNWKQCKVSKSSKNTTSLQYFVFSPSQSSLHVSNQQTSTPSSSQYQHYSQSTAKIKLKFKFKKRGRPLTLKSLKAWIIYMSIRKI